MVRKCPLSWLKRRDRPDCGGTVHMGGGRLTIHVVGIKGGGAGYCRGSTTRAIPFVRGGEGSHMNQSM